MSQNALILQHLNRASITPLEAIERYRCLRLAARINDLKSMGHEINKQMMYLGNKKFARYTLIKRKKK
jgi:hypothetical protein